LIAEVQIKNSSDSSSEEHRFSMISWYSRLRKRNLHGEPGGLKYPATLEMMTMPAIPDAAFSVQY